MGRKLRSVQYRIGAAHEAGQHLRFAIERFVRAVCVEHTTSQCRMLARDVESDVRDRVFKAWLHTTSGAPLVEEQDDAKGGA